MLAKEINNDPEHPFLDWIKSGTKTYEGRLLSRIKLWDLHVDKVIKFFDRDDQNSWVLVKVISLSTFKDFGHAYDSLGDRLIPGYSRAETIELYNNIFLGPKDDDNDTNSNILSEGVVAIGIQVIDES